MTQRQTITLHQASDILGAAAYIADHTARLAAAKQFEVGADGYLSLRCLIDDGAGGAPSDAPVGFWELYAGDGTSFSKVTEADIQLAKIKPSGSVKVEARAILEGVPGRILKVTYLRSSGGGGNSRVTLVATVNR